ncbi:MAG: ATP synthase F1 subunit epsilon [Alphaproteobacteria bacterium]|jgi:F-type H+-transporting ATPase subunit epsilon|nr:ATP synthase F1 subunit epsilon [Alphaproteobacteria bacterium]
MKFDLVTPVKQLASFDAELVVVPGAEGEFGVLENHAPLISTLKPGKIHVRTKSGETHDFAVAYGFADVAGDHVTVLAEGAHAKADIDYKAVDAELKESRKEIAGLYANKADMLDIQNAEKKQAILEAKLLVAEKPLI